MAEIHSKDLVDEASVTSDENGVSAVRKFLVTGLSGEGSSRLLQAITTPDIPIKGQSHPNLGSIIVKSVSAIPVPGCAAAAYVIVQYGSPTFSTQAPSETAPPKYRTTSTVQEVETSEDKNGAQMILKHTKTSVDDNGNNVTETLPDQPAKASVQRPITTFICERAEPLPWNYPGKLPYVGCVNSSPWRGYNPRTVLCMGIDVDESGDRANVSYQFQIKLDGSTWEFRAVYIDPSTGAPVVNPVEGQGIKTFRVYPEADFTQLSV